MEESTLAALRVKYSSMLKPQSIGCCVQKLDDTTLVEKDYFQSIMHLQYFKQRYIPEKSSVVVAPHMLLLPCLCLTTTPHRLVTFGHQRTDQTIMMIASARNVSLVQPKSALRTPPPGRCLATRPVAGRKAFRQLRSERVHLPLRPGPEFPPRSVSRPGLLQVTSIQLGKFTPEFRHTTFSICCHLRLNYRRRA